MSDQRGRVATVGMFDGVHRGHQHVIHQVRRIASERGLIPTVFTFDRHPLSLVAPEKASRLITTAAQRVQLLKDSGAEDVIVLTFDESLRGLEAEPFLAMLRQQYGVDVLVVGYNHHFGKGRQGTFDDYCRMGARQGIEVVRSEEYKEMKGEHQISSSTIRRLIAQGDVSAATRLMGHPYEIEGKVTHGHRIGSKIGYPTANVKPQLEQQILPLEGVYAAWTKLGDGQRYPAMVNIGTNPTVDPHKKDLSIEAHIIGYEGDLYGEIIKIDIVERLREERRFDSLETLAAQLEADRQKTLGIIY